VVDASGPSLCKLPRLRAGPCVGAAHGSCTRVLQTGGGHPGRSVHQAVRGTGTPVLPAGVLLYRHASDAPGNTHAIAAHTAQ